MGSLASRLFSGGRARPALRFELRFGTDLGEQAVVAVLAAVSGLPRRSTVALETVATEAGIRHALVGEQATLETLRGQLRGLVPSLRVEPAAGWPQPAWRAGLRLAWTGSHVLLRTDGAPEAAATLLAAFDPLTSGEALLLQVAVRPAGPRRIAEPAQGSRTQPAPTLAELIGGSTRLSPELARALRAKQTAPLVQARVLLAVACGHPKRAEHLAGRVVAVFRTRRAALGSLSVRPLSASALGRLLARPPRRGSVVSPAELAGLCGWPIGAPRLPGLVLGSAPLLFPDRRIPQDGRPFAFSTWPGLERRPLTQPVLGGLSHTLICGPTGSGKSALISQLVLADLHAGRGCLVLDGKGDLAEDLLARMPARRQRDLILLDPAAAGPVPGLRIFGSRSDPELAADLVLGVLRDLFRDSWGVRSEQWLRSGLVTVAHDPQGTLGDLPYLFSDEQYRHRLVAKLEDPLLLASWAAFEAMHPRERANQLGAPLNKLGELLGRRVLRTVLSQTEPTLDLNQVLRDGKVVVASLAPGRLGAPAARLLGALLVYQLLTAIQARAALPPQRRTPFFAYIDEPRVFADLPVPLDSILELARGLGVGLALSAQSVLQLPAGVREAALTNAATLIAFRQNHDQDAELLARHLPGLTGEALQHLGAFELVARLGLGPGDVAAPASGRSLPPPLPSCDPGQVRAASAAHYGRDPSLVDQALAQRHGQGPAAESSSGDEPPIGRRRRTR